MTRNALDLSTAQISDHAETLHGQRLFGQSLGPSHQPGENATRELDRNSHDAFPERQASQTASEALQVILKSVIMSQIYVCAPDCREQKLT